MPVITSELLKQALVHWRLHPVEAVKDWFGITPEDYQCEILESLLGPNSGSRTSVKSGHGVGKTSTESFAMWVYLNTRANSRVVATAPTQSQLKDILWPEAAKWHEKMRNRGIEIANLWEINETHVR